MNNKPKMRLSPTIWRTCRVLSGRTRLALLRRILTDPGQSVSRLALVEKISIPRASQELRRLQSRGIVGVKRVGRFVQYYPVSDPLVYSAAPILRAMKGTFKQFSKTTDEQIAWKAHGLSHPKRIAIVQVLRQGAMPLSRMQISLQTSGQTLLHHLGFLKEGGWVEKNGRIWRWVASDMPLAKCLLKLL